MNAQATLPLFAQQRQIRTSKRKRIYALFSEHVGQRFSSASLHELFGSAARTRISEINRDPASTIAIKNQVTVSDGREVSVYWAERRTT